MKDVNEPNLCDGRKLFLEEWPWIGKDKIKITLSNSYTRHDNIILYIPMLKQLSISLHLLLSV